MSYHLNAEETIRFLEQLEEAREKGNTSINPTPEHFEMVKQALDY